jgi:hypothetical protein
MIFTQTGLDTGEERLTRPVFGPTIAEYKICLSIRRDGILADLLVELLILVHAFVGEMHGFVQ